MKNDERERERLKLPILEWTAVADGAARLRRAYDLILSASAKRKGENARERKGNDDHHRRERRRVVR